MKSIRIVAGFVAGLGAVACMGGHHDFLSPADLTEVASVVPAGGSIGVDVAGPIRITFSHTMMSGMEAYAMLHEGDINGPEVAGLWSFSTDRMTLSFAPAAPLKAKSTYTIHLGGAMRDGNGNLISYSRCTSTMGGQWANGMPRNMGNMMGSGWQNSNGSFGMTFTFTTK